MSLHALRLPLLLLASALLSSCFVGVVIDADDGATVTVFESNGKRQCEPAAITPQQSARKLTDGGIDVRTSSCAILTNIAYPAVCGAPSGELVVHEISESKAGAAQRLGFSLVTTLRLGNGEAGYAVISCAVTP